MGQVRHVSAPSDGELFQERLRHDPFWMLVACQLVNLTTWTVARHAFDEIRGEYCNGVPLRLALAPDDGLHEVLRPLGMWRRRAVILPRFARAWLRSPPECRRDVERLPGCGKYAADSWSIFVDGDLDVTPRDGKLNWYLEQRKTHDPDTDGAHARPGPPLQLRGDRTAHPRLADSPVERT